MPAPLLTPTLTGLPHVRSGKVRDVYDAGDAYLMVASDRMSAFDCILPNGIPDKGRILNGLSAWWFDRFSDRIAHHVLSTDPDDLPAAALPWREELAGRFMLVKKATVLPVECVARGYLAGSGWKDYRHTGEVCGCPLREGYRLADRLDEPIFTPASKADEGHDENISFETMSRLVGTDLAERLRDLTLQLYRDAEAYARSRGILLADTKVEFGIDPEGTLLLIDELLTPDSSRYWPADAYQPGASPPSFDKQYVRDYLEGLDWDKQPPAPPLPPEVVEGTRSRYHDAYARLTGHALSPS